MPAEPSVITIRTPGLSLPDPGASRETYTRAERVSVATLSLVAAQALRLVSGNRQRHKIVLLDEAWFFLSSAQGRALLNRVIRLGRAFNATVLVATQRLADLGDLSELFGVYFLFGQETEGEARAGLVQISLDGRRGAWLPPDRIPPGPLPDARPRRARGGGAVRPRLRGAARRARQHAEGGRGMKARLALRRWRRPVLAALALSALIVLAAHPLAGAATDVWGNVGPAPQLGSNGLFGRYPLSHYMLDQHFDAVSASLTGGVDVSGVPPMIAYFLASILWLATSFLANLLITLFSFAFSLDLVNGSQATGGAGALGPVSEAIHSIYANVFGAPWLVLAITVAGLWAIWKSLLQRRHSETVGALALSLVYVVLALFFVVQPGTTIGGASKWTNQMSEAFLSISDHGTPSGGAQAKDDAANQLFDLLVFKPWVVLNFGGLEHCAVAGTGSGDADPESAPVRPLSSSPSRDAALARRLASGTEVSADGKVCVNNANKYASHFLRFGLGTDERGERRVRRAERRRLLEAARSRHRKGRLPARGRRQAGDRRDGGGRPVPAAAARAPPLRRRARRLLPAGGALGRGHPRPGAAALAAGLRAGGARRRRRSPAAATPSSKAGWRSSPATCCERPPTR